MSIKSILGGYQDKTYIDNPFTRFHESIEQNPHFLDDIDDRGVTYNDEYERLKPFQPTEYVGQTQAIPL